MKNKNYLAGMSALMMAWGAAVGFGYSTTQNNEFSAEPTPKTSTQDIASLQNGFNKFVAFAAPKRQASASAQQAQAPIVDKKSGLRRFQP